MADKAISELVAAERITETDMFVLEQNGTAKKLTGQVLLNWLTAAADGHGGIQSINKISSSGLIDTYRITLADTTTFDFVVTNGRGVTSVSKTGTSGLVDTYRISYNDGSSDTFTVTNGAKGDKGDNQYVWIKYASQKPTASSHSFGDVADNWIGIYSGESATAPEDWTQYEWFQIKGEKGDTGDPATVISNVVEYQVADSGTIIPSGAWSSSVPVVPQGRYLWTRTTTTFNSGSSAVSYSVSRMGLDGSGSVSSVANISPDENGNVPLTAADLNALSNMGGDLTGELKMNGQPISGLNPPTESTQAANMGYVNAQVKKAAPRNLLDNSDFRNPVNQRGRTSYVNAAEYTIDRWFLAHAGDSGISLSDDGLTFGATNNLFVYFQRVGKEVRKKLIGKTVTVVATDSNGNVGISTGIIPDFGGSVDSTQGTIGSTNIKVNIYVHQADDFIQIRLLTDKIFSPVTIANIALYEGEYTAETLPEYQPKGYGVELAECQRYYLIFTGGQSLGYGYTVDVSNGRIIIPTPVTMRGIPSIDVQGLTFHYCGNGKYGDFNNVQVDSVHSNMVRLNATGTDLPVNCVLMSYTDPNFGLSADL